MPGLPCPRNLRRAAIAEIPRASRCKFSRLRSEFCTREREKERERVKGRKTERQGERRWRGRKKGGDEKKGERERGERKRKKERKVKGKRESSIISLLSSLRHSASLRVVGAFKSARDRLVSIYVLIAEA